MRMISCISTSLVLYLATQPHFSKSIFIIISVKLSIKINFLVWCFFDISKAFDRVGHPGLLHKLEQNGISGDLLLWISDYLSNRTQSVVLNSVTSTKKYITAGVPQGSLLGPLLFLIYVNDISENLLS